IVGMTVTLGNGKDTVNVEGTIPSDPLTVNLGSGTDTVNITPTSQVLGNIQGAVTINPGAFGSATLNVDDQNNAGGATWTLTSSSVSSQLSAPITYFDMDQVNVNGGSGDNLYSVLGTEGLLSTNLNTAGARDTVVVQATSGPLTINSVGQDTIEVGDN